MLQQQLLLLLSNVFITNNGMMIMCSEHLSDVMMISQAFTAISSRITGMIMFLKVVIIIIIKQENNEWRIVKD